MSTIRQASELIVEAGASIFARGLTPGCTGNFSVLVGDELVMTSTGSSLGRLRVEDLSIMNLSGEHLAGPAPTKEWGLHLALYSTGRGQAVVHLHSPHAMAWSCRAELPVERPIPYLTPYLVMRASDLRLVPYSRPGSASLLTGVREAAKRSRALLLQRHGTLNCAADLCAAVDVAEEIEQAAWVAIASAGAAPELDDRQVRELLDN